MPDPKRPAAEQGRLAKLTAAALTDELSGQRFELSPICLREWAQLKRFAQGKAVEEFCRLEQAMIAAGASKDALDQLRVRALFAIDHPLETFPADLQEVKVERVYLSLRPKQPDITREKVEQLLEDEIARERVQRDLEELAATEARIKNGSRARGKRPARRPRRATPKPSGSTPSSSSPNSTTGRPAKSGK